MRVSRWYCRDAHVTFSLLPDCLAARLGGSLDEAEQIVLEVERSRSLEAAAAVVRPDIELPGAMRWVRRRVLGVRAALLALVTLMPGRFGMVAQVSAVRSVLGSERALVALREIGASHLPNLVRPVGFRPHRRSLAERGRRLQHRTGPDPPASTSY
jgi:hypothetical protein